MPWWDRDRDEFWSDKPRCTSCAQKHILEKTGYSEPEWKCRCGVLYDSNFNVWNRQEQGEDDSTAWMYEGGI